MPNPPKKPKASKKPTLHLAGPNEGMLTIDDLTALYLTLTGKEPTAEEIEESRRILNDDEDPSETS